MWHSKKDSSDLGAKRVDLCFLAVYSVIIIDLIIYITIARLDKLP